MVSGWVGCKRVEINTLGARGVVEYLDKAILDRIGGYDKVIPPDDVQRVEADNVFESELDSIVEAHFAERMQKMRDRLRKFSLPKDFNPDVSAYLGKNKKDRWQRGVEAGVSAFLQDMNAEIQKEINAGT